MANNEIDQTIKSFSNLNVTTPPCPCPFPSTPSLISSTIYKGLWIPSSWVEATDSIAYDSCTFPPPIVFICGPGNSGKSIFSRVLLDTLFKRYGRVGYLDTDLGQPEFTPSGCISLHIIEKETPDLTVLCLKKPEKFLFFGDICAKSNAKDYVFYIFNMYNYFIKKFYKIEGLGDSDNPCIPLIVNTSGWIKGFGFDMLVDILRYMSPTHVVKVECSTASKNLPSGAFWLIGNQKQNAEIIEICAIQKQKNNLKPSKKDARAMRDLRFITYFKQCLPKDLEIESYADLKSCLASIPPFELCFSKINITFLPGSTKLTYHNLIGMIVGLAISSFSPSAFVSQLPWCVGLGIVRSIDIEKDKIYLVAPLPLHIVREIDALYGCSIEIPNIFGAGENLFKPSLADQEEELLKYQLIKNI